jgi:hypothetical protein
MTKTLINLGTWHLLAGTEQNDKSLSGGGGGDDDDDNNNNT